jgi:hypothetical protein
MHQCLTPIEEMHDAATMCFGYAMLHQLQVKRIVFVCGACQLLLQQVVY